MVQDPLSLKAYTIKRNFFTDSLKSVLNFEDSDGNAVLNAYGEPLVTRYEIQTIGGQVLGTITHRKLSIPGTYDLHDGDEKGNIIATIKEDLTAIIGPRGAKIEDSNGNVLAKVKGQLWKFEYDIIDNNGNQIAKVTPKFMAMPPDKKEGILQRLGDAVTNTFTLTAIRNPTSR